MNRRQFAALMSTACLTMGCDTEQKPVAAAQLNCNSENVKNMIENLGAAIGDLEGHVDGLQHGDWRTFVPRVERTAGEIRIAFEHLRKALGMPTA